MNGLEEKLITIISNRCEKAPYVDVADAVDDILKRYKINEHKK